MTDDMKYTVFYTDENGQLVPNGEKLLSITEIAKYRIKPPPCELVNIVRS